MADEQPVVQNEIVSDDAGTPPAKTQEELELEAKKAELEAQVLGLEGTVESLKDDIVRKRQERRGEEQQPAIDKEAFLAELQPVLEEKLREQIKPVLEENEKLRKAILESNEKELKAKKSALESLNARIASATASRSSAVNDQQPEEVELSADEKKIAQELGLKNPRYMKDVEIG